MRRVSVPVLAAVALAANVALRALATAERASSLEQTDYGEGPLAAVVARWLVESPGRQWLGVPFTATAYGPLVLAIWRWAAMIWPNTDLLLVGRAVVLTATTLLLVSVAIAAFREGRSLLASLTAIALVLGSQVAIDWFPTARVDGVASAFAAGAYMTFGRHRLRLCTSAALLVLATLAKQTAGLHLLPLLWIAYKEMGRRRSIRFASLTAAMLVAAWAITFSLYDGYFLVSAVWNNSNRFSLWQYVTVGQVWFSSAPAVIMLSATGIWLVLDPAGASRNRWLVGFLVAVAGGILTSMKEGSYLNYFLDATWLGAIVVGRLAGESLRRWPIQAASGMLLAASVSLPGLVLPRVWRGSPAVASYIRAEEINRILNEAPAGSLLADGQLVSFVADQRGLLINDPFLFRLRDDKGLAPTKEILLALEEPAATVLLSERLAVHRARPPLKRDWPAALLDRISTDFCLTEQYPDLFVYRSRRSTHGCPVEKPG